MSSEQQIILTSSNYGLSYKLQASSLYKAMEGKSPLLQDLEVTTTKAI